MTSSNRLLRAVAISQLMSRSYGASAMGDLCHAPKAGNAVRVLNHAALRKEAVGS